MKTQEQLEFALEKKQIELSDMRKRVEELNLWMDANNVFPKNDNTFLEKLLTEKAEENRRVEQLQAQVAILKWCIE